jgi:hypothetical protein
MSAFEVSNTHIDALVSAALSASRHGPLSWYHGDIPRTERGEMLPGDPEYLPALARTKRTVTPENAGTWGATLLAENRRSVNWRYDEEEFEEPYEFRRIGGHLSAVAILKAIDCYDYQACEHPDWPQSEAYDFCQALRAAMIHQLPGYDAAAWEINERSEATTGVQRNRNAA